MNTNEYIDKYLTGQITDEESAQLLDWVKESAEHKKEFDDACRLWYLLQSDKFNSDKAFEEFKQKTKKKSIIIPLWQKISAVAAVALIAIVSLSILSKTDVNTITIQNTEMAVQTVTLPDGSTIYLQKDASVTYPEKFENGSRTISATGNIFCEISHDESAPFSLTDNDLHITVLGTSFQVNTRDSVFVFVETGKVRVSTETQNAVITAGERADLRDEQLVCSKNTEVNLLSWKTGVLKFDNTDLQSVFTDLSRHYNCTFSYTKKCSDIQNYKLTGTYQDLSLEQTLQMIELAIPDIHYDVNGSEVVVSNSK